MPRDLKQMSGRAGKEVEKLKNLNSSDNNFGVSEQNKEKVRLAEANINGHLKKINKYLQSEGFDVDFEIKYLGQNSDDVLEKKNPHFPYSL